MEYVCMYSKRMHNGIKTVLTLSYRLEGIEDKQLVGVVS